MTKKADKLVPTARRITVSLTTLAGEVDSLTKFAAVASLIAGDVRVSYSEGRVTIEKGQERQWAQFGHVPNPDFQRASFDVDSTLADED